MTAGRPRVMIIAHDVDDSGGMERAFTELIRRGNAQVDFTVVSSTLAPDLAALVEWRRVRIPRRPFPLKFLVFFALAATVRSRGADLVHTCGAIVPRRADLVSIHFCHAGYRAKTGQLAPASGPLLRRINTLLSRGIALTAERLCYRPAVSRRLACVSSGVREEIRAAYPGVQTVITPNGVDTWRFRPNLAMRASLRAAEGVGDTDHIALFVGGDWDRKGLPLALSSLAVANRARGGTRTRLWVVGTGDTHRYTRLAHQLGVQADVRFFGHRSETETFYQAADLLVFPSLYEAFPLVALEAAACGLPVIGARLNGVVELVEAGGGMIVDRTPEAFAAGLGACAEDRDRARAMGRAGAAWVGDLSWDRSATSVIAEYRDLLRGAPAPPTV